MPVQFDPAKLIAGPAIVTYNGVTWYSKDDIAVRIVRETWDVATSRHGRIDQRMKSISAEITFTPSGQVDQIAGLLPYGPDDIGANIFPTVDLPLVIHSIAGTKYTFARAAQIGLPSLTLAATNTALGAVTFLCLLKSNTAPTTDDSFLKIEAAAFSDATFDETEILSPGYTASYGVSFTALESQDGFSIEFGMDIVRDYVDRIGLVGARLKSLTAAARFKPTGITEAEYHTLCVHDGTGALVPGESLAKADTDLVITGTGLAVTIYKAGLATDALAFGDANRLGELVFTSRRSWTAGAADPLWAIATS